MASRMVELRVFCKKSNLILVYDGDLIWPDIRHSTCEGKYCLPKFINRTDKNLSSFWNGMLIFSFNKQDFISQLKKTVVFKQSCSSPATMQISALFFLNSSLLF